MKHSIVIVIMLSVVVTAFPEVVCQGEHGYMVRQEVRLLKCDKFNETDLRKYFARYVSQSDTDEFFVVATCDLEFYRKLKDPSLTWGSLHDLREVPIWTAKPLAYFFRFEDNCFVQYRDDSSRIKWFTISGENLFHKRFGETVVKFVGHSFRRRAGEIYCHEMMRRLLFLADNPNLANLVEAARFYEKMFPEERAGRFWLEIYGSKDIALENAVTFPNLSLMNQFRERPYKSKEFDGPYPAVPSPRKTGWICRVTRGGGGLSGLRRLQVLKDNELILSKTGPAW